MIIYIVAHARQLSNARTACNFLRSAVTAAEISLEHARLAVDFL